MIYSTWVFKSWLVATVLHWLIVTLTLKMVTVAKKYVAIEFISTLTLFMGKKEELHQQNRGMLDMDMRTSFQPCPFYQWFWPSSSHLSEKHLVSFSLNWSRWPCQCNTPVWSVRLSRSLSSGVFLPVICIPPALPSQVSPYSWRIVAPSNINSINNESVLKDCGIVERTCTDTLGQLFSSFLKHKLTLYICKEIFFICVLLTTLLAAPSHLLIFLCACPISSQPQELTDILEISNMVFTSLFSLEMLLKLLALGLFGYIKNPYNGFDSVIVIIR